MRCAPESGHIRPALERESILAVLMHRPVSWGKHFGRPAESRPHGGTWFGGATGMRPLQDFGTASAWVRACSGVYIVVHSCCCAPAVGPFML